MRNGIILLAFTLAACGDDGGSSTDADGGPRVDAGGIVDVTTTMPSSAPIAPSSECRVTTWREPALSAAHVPACAELDYPHHPPSSGTHYGAWADFGTYDAPVPWGFLVHAMEHGGIVLAYDCPEGCADVIAALEAIVADHGTDPACASHPTADARFIITPDPALEDGSIAAVAWEQAYVATCLDEPSLRAFVEAHYAMGPEDLCAAGLEGSAGGWCP